MGLGHLPRRLPRYREIVERRFRQESLHEALRRLWLFRPGHSVFRHAVHAQPHVARPGPARKSQPGLLRRWTHDVYPGLFFGRTEEGCGSVYAERAEVREIAGIAGIAVIARNHAESGIISTERGPNFWR